MASSEASLLVRIKEEGKKALTDISQGLDDIKVKAAAVSAALTGFIALTVSNYAGAEQAANALNAALRSQGLNVDTLSAKYTNYAKAIQNATTFDDDAVISGLALAQSQIGNIEITEDLIKATVDLAAAKKMDLNSAFEIVGKSIGTNTNALARHGVELAENLTVSQKMDSVTKQLSNTWNGAAAAQTKGLGSLKQLKNEFGELLEIIGKQFAPFISKASQFLIDLIKQLQNDSFAKWTAILVASGAALSGLIAVLGTLIGLLPTISAGVSALGIAFRFMLGPLGLIITGISALGIAWKTNFLNIQQITDGTFAAVATAIEEISSIFSDFGNLLKSVFNFDAEGIKSSFDVLKKSVSSISDHTKKSFKEAYENRTKSIENSIKDIEKIEDKSLEDRAKKRKVATQKEIEEEQKQINEWYEWQKNKKDEANDERIRQSQQIAQLEERRTKEMVQRTIEITTATITGGLQSAASKGIGYLVAALGAPELSGAASGFFDLLSKNTEEFKETLYKMFGTEFIDNVVSNLITLVEELPGILDRIINYLAENMPAIVENLIKSIIGSMPEITASFGRAFTEMLSNPKFVADLAAAIAKGFVAGIKEAAGDITEALKKAFRDAAEGITGVGEVGGFVGRVTSGFRSVLPGARGGFFAHGGPILPSYAGGGLIDNQVIRAHAGEFVTNKDSTSANLGLLNAINSSNGRSVGMGNSIVINVNGGLLGDRQSAEQFARAVDEELFKLRQGNASRAFDKSIY